MKKSTQFNQQVRNRLPLVLVSALLIGACLSGAALAEDKIWEIQSGNTLGKIVAEQYPGYANRQAIMQELLKRNPDAFSNQNINSLIVGKTLKLPDASDIPDLKPPAPQQGGSIDPATQEKLQSLETQVTELNDAVALLEEENAALQEMVKGYADAKPTPTGGEDLQKQLDAAKQALQESQAASSVLEEQVAEAKRGNDTLQNDLQQIRAAAALAENNASGSGNLPWILLGLLALLALPLVWLLRRKREQSPVAVVSTTTTAATAVTSPAMVPGQEAVVTPEAGHLAAGASYREREADTAEENPDAALKLDIARAYLDLRDSGAAADILQDVLVEGGEQQRQEAREILSFIS
jgi:FimV-like protein